MATSFVETDETWFSDCEYAIVPTPYVTYFYHIPQGGPDNCKSCLAGSCERLVADGFLLLYVQIHYLDQKFLHKLYLQRQKFAKQIIL